MKAEDIFFNPLVYNVKDTEHKYFQVKKIDKNSVMDKNGSYISLINDRRIPITAEILEKNGFSVTSDVYPEHYEAIYRNAVITVKMLDDGVIFAHIEKDVESSGLNAVHKAVKYVSDLQLLLRILDIDMDIIP